MPNPDSLQAQVFGDRWFALDLPRHLVHVPAPTLLTRLGGLGLEPTRVSHLRGGQVLFGWLHGIVGSLPEHADLYDAIRSPEARRRPMSSGQRAATLAAGAVAAAGLGRLHAARGGAAPRRHRLRRGPPWLRAPSQTERRNEPAPTRGKTIVVMPALNAAKTLELTVSSIPRDVVDEVLLVDDRSTDETLEIARGLDVSVIWHPHNVGYGGNQKTCYLEALQREADIIVMLHPDGQYEPALIPKLIEPIQAGAADMVLGSRMLVPGAAREAGMPLYKRVANRFLTTVENRVLRTHLTDLHTGYRAYSRELLLDGAVPAELARLQLRLRAADAGLPVRLPDRRGPGAHALLRGGLLGRLRCLDGLRAEDALGRRPPASPPHPPAALAEVLAVIACILGTGKVTGERVTTPAGGFNPTWQRHVAAYELCAALLPEGRILDLGCGVGHSYHLLAPRETVGVDIDPEALAGQERETHVADMRDLPFTDDDFDGVIAVQSIEHVPGSRSASSLRCGGC